MDRRLDREENVTVEFSNGVDAFLHFARQQPSYEESRTLLCPCSRCRNTKQWKAVTVAKHLLLKGFMANYYVWTSHGESCFDTGESSQSRYTGGAGMWDNNQVPAYEHVPDADVRMGQVQDAFIQPNVQVPNEEQCNDPVFHAFEEANQPLYNGCVEGISQLYVASRMLNIKTTYNLPEACMDEICQLQRDILPMPNKAPGSYYEIKKLTRSLGLPLHKIDVCEDYCMIFWKSKDRDLLQCRFCHKDRFKPTNVEGKKKPKQRMFYLPLADRLKRLYQLDSTASQMRWHAEHTTPEGEMHHPSDAKAWKHFQTVYPDFAAESRNIYLGLSTNGFNPVGMNGEAHSVWPVIVTPYNLPPGMCMKKEYFFLTILVPGPKNPKRSLDVFLEPLIDELQILWENGVDAYDVSLKQNFKLRAALMWTISDFPAYGMLSGWMTHGRLACPYCLDDTKSFWLANGRKHSWFDCHRAFLPENHRYRRNLKAFRRGKAINDQPPPWLTGEEILHERINNIEGVSKTADYGGKGHDKPKRTIEGYGDYHNWVKKSIFWELPYWENHLLRHNLDLMHVEKNFFDNLINTVLNAPGKTKDNIKSRMDLPSICRRPDLEIAEDGSVPVPTFRLSNTGKQRFLKWLKDEVKFPDGYASKFGRCVDKNNSKLSGLKSHDCHVIMQRLLPFAFAELLPKSIHTAISDIALFFRDIAAKTLNIEDVKVLKENISVKLCNLEKIFPPSFFDVMEHLPVHLPDEAALGGPVQYRWMYPFERYMYHLKKKVRNRAHIGGSIAAQCVTEEISYAASNYFSRHDVPEASEVRGDVNFTYAYPDVPNIFHHVGRVGGQMVTGSIDDNDYNILQTFLLLNCDEFAPYERMYEECMTSRSPGITANEMEISKDKYFAKWVKDYVNKSSADFVFLLWMLEFVQGPRLQTTSWPTYYTRGYQYHTHTHGEDKITQNYGVCVRGSNTETEYYGIIDEIFQMGYHGAVGLRAIIFKCRWFDTISCHGIRKHPSGIVDVSPQRQLEKYDPFVLPGQCDQVCYVPYPHERETLVDDWWTCTKVLPRGVRESSEVAHVALQDDTHRQFVVPSGTIRIEDLVVHDDSDYDGLPMSNANDEYVSDADLQDPSDDSDSEPEDVEYY